MPPFVFKLDPLLRARKAAEQKVQRAVAELQREQRTLENKIRRQQQHITSGKSDRRDHLIGALDAESLRSKAAGDLQATREAQRLVLELAGLHKRLESTRQELVNASRSRRAIELLREQRYFAWKKDVDRKENAALDELAVIAAGRNRGEQL